jgi:quinol-cytochrome oxidoreductase complex cytochrome b subunit
MSSPAPNANGASPRPSAPGVHPVPLWSLRPRSDRESGDAIVSNFILHWFPSKVFRPSLDWSYSFWLGTASAALFLLLILSGLPLLFLYIPSVERAYASIKDIEYVITFGSWLRSVHRISAHLMVAAVALHLVRVFLTGAYKNGVGRGQRREWNWVLGVGMLLSTLFLSFTGYLLPWDQLAYWAVTVGTNIAASIPLVGPAVRELMIGGRSIEQPTLIRFYVLHVVLLPMALGALFVYHMWRVRKDGGLARSDRDALAAEPIAEEPGRSKTYTLLGVARGTTPALRAKTLERPDTTANAVPDLTRRAAVVTLGTIAIVSILATLIRSPLEEAANPLVTPNPAKAPWYFLWLQEIVTDTTVRIGSFTLNGAFLGGVILPGLLIGVLTAWPWLDRSSREATGVWFARDRRTQNLVFLALCLVVLALTVVGTFLRGPYWHLYWPWEAWPEIPGRI